MILTYHLIFQGEGQVPSAAKLDEDKAPLRQTLQRWSNTLSDVNDLPPYLAYSLDHEYSEANMRYSKFKGNHRARAQCMIQLGIEMNFRCYLALVERSLVRREGEGNEENCNSDLGEEIKFTSVFTKLGKRNFEEITDITSDVLAKEHPWNQEPHNIETVIDRMDTTKTYRYKKDVSIWLFCSLPNTSHLSTNILDASDYAKKPHRGFGTEVSQNMW